MLKRAKNTGRPIVGDDAQDNGRGMFVIALSSFVGFPVCALLALYVSEWTMFLSAPALVIGTVIALEKWARPL